MLSKGVIWLAALALVGESVASNIHRHAQQHEKKEMITDIIFETEFAIDNGAQVLLSFNEPDLASQCNISPEQAAADHQKWMNPFQGKVRISSPAITNAYPSPGNMVGTNWLSAWFAACGGQCACDVVAIHWYNHPDVGEFIQHARDVYAIAQRPVWFTEFQPIGASDAQIGQFLEDLFQQLASDPSLSFIERIAYFMVSEDNLVPGGAVEMETDFGDSDGPSLHLSAPSFEGAGGGGGGGVVMRTVKRPRPVKSCLECRKRKLRCDRLPVCSQCQKSKRACRYSDTENGTASDGSEAEGGGRPVKRAQRSSVAASLKPEWPAAHRNPGPASGSDVQVAAAALRPPSVSMEVSARLDRLERLLVDQGSPALSSTARQGIHHTHQTQPRTHSARVVASPLTIRSLSVKGGLRTRFVGQNNTKVLLNLFDEAKDYIRNLSKRDGMREVFFGLQEVHKALQAEHRKALEPISVFVDSMMPVQKRMADILPKKAACDRLLQAYIGMSEGLYRVIHIPSFRHEYDDYWEGKGAYDAFLPRLLCMLSIASRFDTESRGLSHDRCDSVHVPTACRLVRHWLDNLRGKQLVDMYTLETEILILHAQRMMKPRPQDSWTQLGLIVRMAMAMGLHRDPCEFPQLSPFLGEQRRRLWYTIMDMDLHVSLACNLPCAAREGEYTCKPPRNLDDEDLEAEMKELPESRPMEEKTTGQMQVCAASTIPWRIKASAILSRLETVHEYDEVLEVGGRLERVLDDINCIFPRHATLEPDEKFQQWRDRALLDMHVRRPLLDLYRPFVLSASTCPRPMASSYLKSCMVMLTYMDELDPRLPGFKEVTHMYQLVLKHDIVQAAFSLCFFIKKAADDDDEGEDGAAGMSRRSSDRFTLGQDGGHVWSTATLIRLVEKTLDGLLGLIRDSSSDLRDVITLCIVLNTVQAGSGDQKLERTKEGVRRILNVAMQALNAKSDGISSQPIKPACAATGSLVTNVVPHDPYDTGPAALNAFIAPDFFPSEIPDRFPMWDSFLDYWNPDSAPID
ncbi:hypothetical protein P8C59_007278 [Phyllachora maydis]|uniref:Zn(2)-C6 fungal-type domain-containing protein n=1 Tax=Phyllachora maydis TaxID=1825666 RepID=A0AAD9MHY9_9PEZI|nr:hypothetical protein P8C59_007278 [Phyllachora maydis]